jgi:hypothetical protein
VIGKPQQQLVMQLGFLWSMLSVGGLVQGAELWMSNLLIFIILYVVYSLIRFNKSMGERKKPK